MPMIRLLFLIAMLAACTKGGDAIENALVAYSDIKMDESVVFFRSSGWLDPAGENWHVPIHGWVYEPQTSVARKAIISKILKSQYGLATSGETNANFGERVNLLLADNERDKQIVVRIGTRDFVLPPSSADGHFELTLVIPRVEIEPFAQNGLIRYVAVTRKGDTRIFSGESLLLPPEGLSIISDIDDTIKISHVTDRKKLLDYTFFRDFAAAPGMAQRYGLWAKQGASLHYVSSSPWQLYVPLQEFVDTHGFPWATFSLKSVRFRDETVLNLFQEGIESKPPQIEFLLNAYRKRVFILVGDSGEQDPEVYAMLARRYPDQILKIYIRNVTGEAPDNERFSALFQGIDPDVWRLFQDPLTLSDSNSSKP